MFIKIHCSNICRNSVSYFSSLQDSHYFLLVAKGQHVLVFLLSILTPKDVKVIHRCIEDSLHAFPSSGETSPIWFRLLTVSDSYAAMLACP